MPKRCQQKDIRIVHKVEKATLQESGLLGHDLVKEWMPELEGLQPLPGQRQKCLDHMWVKAICDPLIAPCQSKHLNTLAWHPAQRPLRSRGCLVPSRRDS